MRDLICLLPLVAAIGCAHPKAAATAKDTMSSGSNRTSSKEGSAIKSETGGADDKCGTIRVHFAFNSSEIAPEDKGLLERSAQCLKQDKALHVTVEGNADERGTEEYNLALGDQRAQSVSRYLQALGASGLQLKTVSYGKVNPVCTEHTEECWAKNRQAALNPSKK
jgi:peptidoglycan-associated lipoprotein